MTLGDEEARRRGVQKSILERASPPSFDVAVEMEERDRWRVHLDVGTAVDTILAGQLGRGNKPGCPLRAQLLYVYVYVGDG